MMWRGLRKKFKSLTHFSFPAAAFCSRITPSLKLLKEGMLMFPNSDDFEKRLLFIKGKIDQHLQAKKLDDKIFEMIQDDYQAALVVEGVVLSRFEQQRMLRDLLGEVFERVIKKAQ
jgi:hypothetical protein